MRVDRFSEFEPDIVPDGCDDACYGWAWATRFIKQKKKANYIPVIFLTAMSDDQALIKCLDAGGMTFVKAHRRGRSSGQDQGTQPNLKNSIIKSKRK